MDFRRGWLRNLHHWPTLMVRGLIFSDTYRILAHQLRKKEELIDAFIEDFSTSCPINIEQEGFPQVNLGANPFGSTLDDPRRCPIWVELMVFLGDRNL